MADLQLLIKLREYLLKNLGLNFSENRNKELYAKMEEASKVFKFEEVDKFIEWLINNTLDTNQIEQLASFLTIGETYFLREKKALDYLEYEYLPKLIRERKGKNKYLKIWSAGCSSGEEAYSVAIMLKRLISDLDDWNVTIKATDINPNFLAKARKGEYTEWSFRGIPDSFKSKYFKKLNKDKYIINDDIREMVDFSFINLMSDNFCNPDNNINLFDVILCRNVMIYFSNEGIQYVTSKFYDSLRKGGVLILSPVESTHLISSMFCRCLKDGVTVYKKDQKDERNVVPVINSKKKFKVSHVIGNNNNFTKVRRNIPIGSKTDVLNLRKPDYKKTKEYNKEEDKNKAAEYEELVIKYKEGLHEKVESQVNSFIDNTEDYRFYLLLARIKADRNNLVDAERLCLKAIEMNKVSANSHYLLANILFEQGKEIEAIESLNKSIFLEPNYALSYFLLGNIYKAMGRIEDSRRNFNNAKKSLLKLSSNDMIAEYEDLKVEDLDKTLSFYLV